MSLADTLVEVGCSSYGQYFDKCIVYRRRVVMTENKGLPWSLRLMLITEILFGGEVAQLFTPTSIYAGFRDRLMRAWLQEEAQAALNRTFLKKCLQCRDDAGEKEVVGVLLRDRLTGLLSEQALPEIFFQTVRTLLGAKRYQAGTMFACTGTGENRSGSVTLHYSVTLYEILCARIDVTVAFSKIITARFQRSTQLKAYLGQGRFVCVDIPDPDDQNPRSESPFAEALQDALADKPVLRGVEYLSGIGRGVITLQFNARGLRGNGLGPFGVVSNLNRTISAAQHELYQIATIKTAAL